VRQTKTNSSNCFRLEFSSFSTPTGTKVNLRPIHGKGAKERDMPLDQCLRKPIRQYLAAYRGLSYLFEGSEKGQPYPSRTVQKIYDNACANNLAAMKT
jgi:integrase